MQRENLDILLVEDNIGDARLIDVLLSEEGGAEFRLDHVERLADAVDRLHDQAYDVVLLDLSLPDSFGLETVRKLRSEAANTPIVILSGLDNEETALRALQSGAQDYLVKGRADGNLIKRSILYAMERQRIRQRVLVAEAPFMATDTGIVVLDTRYRIIRVNPAFTRLTGYDQQEVEGQAPFMIGSGEKAPDYHEAILQEIDPETGWEGEVWNRHKDGKVYPVWLHLNAVRDEGGTLTGYVAVLSDITHRKKAEAELVRQATRDALTGLPNRTLLRRMMQDMVTHALKNESGCGFLFVDLDGFKAVNDSYGHDVGDELLKDVARRLRAALRASDEVGRLGGDEFVVLLGDVRQVEDAGKVAGKIVAALAEPYVLNGITAEISASVGVALCPDDGTTGEDLLKAADEAMYRAKKAGKNRWCYRHSDESTASVGL